MRSRLGDAARDVTEGKITLEEVTRAIPDAIRDRNLRLADQGALYIPFVPSRPSYIPVAHLDPQISRIHNLDI
jgi:hypothetical protein